MVKKDTNGLDRMEGELVPEFQRVEASRIDKSSALTEVGEEEERTRELVSSSEQLVDR